MADRSAPSSSSPSKPDHEAAHCDPELSLPEQDMDISDEKMLENSWRSCHPLSYNTADTAFWSPKSSNDNTSPRSLNLSSSVVSHQPSLALPWTLSDGERKAYDRAFAALDQCHTGLFGGDSAPRASSHSGLSADDLGKIWELADVHVRGGLDKAEFRVAMGLINRRLLDAPIPDQLPPELSQELPIANAGSTSEAIQTDSPAQDNADSDNQITVETSRDAVEEPILTRESLKPSDRPFVDFQREMAKTAEELARLDQEIRTLTENVDLPTTDLPSYSPPPPPPPPLPPPPPPIASRTSFRRNAKPLPPLPPLPILNSGGASPAAMLPRGDPGCDVDLWEDRIDELLDKLVLLKSKSTSSSSGPEDGRRKSKMLRKKLISLFRRDISQEETNSKDLDTANTKPKISSSTLGPPRSPSPLRPPRTRSGPLAHGPPPSSPAISSPTVPRLNNPSSSKRRPPPPPPSRPPSVAVTNLIQAIKAGKKLKPTETVVKRGQIPTGKVLGGEDGNEATTSISIAIPDTDVDGVEDVRIPQPIPSLPSIPQSLPPPLQRPVTPPTTDGSDLLRAIEAGTKLRPTTMVVKQASFPLGKVLESKIDDDADWDSPRSEPAVQGSFDDFVKGGTEEGPVVRTPGSIKYTEEAMKRISLYTHLPLPSPLPPVFPLPDSPPMEGPKLLQAIKSGKELRPTTTMAKDNAFVPGKVKQDECTNWVTGGGPESSPRSDLLKAIQAGQELRPTAMVVKQGAFPLGTVVAEEKIERDVAAPPQADFDSDFVLASPHPRSPRRSTKHSPSYPPLPADWTSTSQDKASAKVKAARMKDATRQNLATGAWFSKDLEAQSARRPAAGADSAMPTDSADDGDEEEYVMV